MYKSIYVYTYDKHNISILKKIQVILSRLMPRYFAVSAGLYD